MHVKFEKSNTLLKSILEIDSLGEYIEKITLKDLSLQEDDKPKDVNMVKLKMLKWSKFNHF